MDLDLAQVARLATALGTDAERLSDELARISAGVPPEDQDRVERFGRWVRRVDARLRGAATQPSGTVLRLALTASWVLSRDREPT